MTDGLMIQTKKLKKLKTLTLIICCEFELRT